MKSYHIAHLEPKTISWWRARRDKIDFDPPYQRKGKIWSDADKAYLIDSILNGYDIPKIYVADFSWGRSPLNKKGKLFAIVDGKQRFEAILDFYDGRIALSSEFVFAENEKLKLASLGYRDLLSNHPDIAEIFDQFNLSVVGIRTNKVEVVEELFLRLNRSKPLTGAEVRNAFSGRIPAVARELAKHEFFTECIRFNTGRGQDWNTATKLVLFEFESRLLDTKKKTLDGFARDAATNKEKVELAARRARDILDDLEEVFLPRDQLLANAGMIPNYYWFVRTRKKNQLPQIRSYLVEFDEARKVVREKLRAGRQLNGALQDFVKFETFNRSTNDELSHTGRAELLEKWFSTPYRSRLSRLVAENR